MVFVILSCPNLGLNLSAIMVFCFRISSTIYRWGYVAGDGVELSLLLGCGQSIFFFLGRKIFFPREGDEMTSLSLARR